MNQSRRRVLQHLGLGLATSPFCGIGLGTAFAQDSAYPTHAVRVVLPFSAGGSSDVAFRVLADGLSRAWGKPVLVDNRPGAGGMIGADAVAKAAPDGYTLLATLTNLVMAPALFGKAPYNAQRDFAPITELATLNLAWVVHKDLPVVDIKSLIEYAKKQGQPLPYGTYAVGGTGHLLMESFGRSNEVPLVHVPYKGEAPLVNDMLGGQVQIGIIGPANAKQHAGRLRTIAVSGVSRSPLLPGVPTFKEQGYAGLERQGWFGLLAPAGTPASIIDKVSADVNNLMVVPAIRARMAEIGYVLVGGTPASFAKTVKTDERFWKDIIAASNIHLD
ncbi:Bug family tripartite tricarboxylate transporter substrate binding protein [Cupriavidus consociatus]|uniref:Bug family tripartite tricarboxylate transporter substrate binding protein n=1 Tax=Cupriavidus consociatus TaxID=2821357 RepID=UPI001AE69524|nr:MULTISPECIES: tripartite tricarboxylate transporter substrate binding protein [unclassified Cupriavidus]MBP0623776.1 tripartite tricarboxylate transporter substrate binding protein [Cupriavidus sp. LEh25]MDK2660482.1 tripartite tricarboxylate transporter substrate binding protein [Cupriavidus sp. LEh21]